MLRKEFRRRPSNGKPVFQVGFDRIFQEGVWKVRKFVFGAGIKRHAREKVEQKRKIRKMSEWCEISGVWWKCFMGKAKVGTQITAVYNPKSNGWYYFLGVSTRLPLSAATWLCLVTLICKKESLTQLIGTWHPVLSIVTFYGVPSPFLLITTVGWPSR